MTGTPISAPPAPGAVDAPVPAPPKIFQSPSRSYLNVDTDDALEARLKILATDRFPVNLELLVAEDDAEGLLHLLYSEPPAAADKPGPSYIPWKKDIEPLTPLMVAATHGSLAALRLLLSLPSVNVNRRCGPDGNTALHCAVYGGAVDAVKLLLAAGADANATDAYGCRPADVIPAWCHKIGATVALQDLLGLPKVDRTAAASLISSTKSTELPRVATSEKKEYPEDPSLSDSKNIIYASDEFRMYYFKIWACSREYSHDQTECPFAHPGENARRRDPRKYHYSCEPCPDFREGVCRRGDMCEYAHGIFECWLHPAQYRTRLCKDGTGCNRRVCFFAHTTDELRPLYVSTGSVVPSSRSSPPPMALVRRLRDKSSAPLISDSWKSPGDRPLPSPPSNSKGVSFPNAKVCEVLDKIWASRRLSLPQLCDNADNVTVREHDILPPHELLVTTALGEMSIRDTPFFSKEAEVVTSDTIDVSQTSPHSLQPISARLFPDWQLRFFIREDLDRVFHTYPHLGGPFCSIQEAEDAISRHLDEARSPKMFTDGLSRSEICIRNTLYWPDGTRKKLSKSSPKHRNYVALVNSLLDKYNEDHRLSGDRAFELEDVVSYGEVYERDNRHHMFYHINLTTKPRRADGFHSGDGNLFFAEVTCLNGENEEYVLNCFCLVNSNDKGRCYDCEINGSVDLKHPTDSHKYNGGRSSPYPRCRGFVLPREILGDFCAYDNEEAMLAAEESRIRHIYKCLDDEAFLAKLDGARTAAPADSSKIQEGLIVAPAKLDDARRAAPADSSKTEGKGLIKYVPPAMRLKREVGQGLIVAPAKLDGARTAAPADSSKTEGKGLIKYVPPAMRLKREVGQGKFVFPALDPEDRLKQNDHLKRVRMEATCVSIQQLCAELYAEE